MSEKDLQEQIDELLKNPEILPVIKRNKNNKTITVKNKLCDHRIKLIASYYTWLDCEKMFEEHDYVPFNLIKKIVSKREKQKKVDELEKIYDSNITLYSNEFYLNFILPSIEKNPYHDFGKKKRGQPPGYEDIKDMAIFKFQCLHIYVFIKYWSKKPKNNYPDILRNYLDKHPIDLTDPVEATKQILANHYPNAATTILEQDRQTFLNNLLRHHKKAVIEKFYQKHHYQPPVDPTTGNYSPSARYLTDILTEKHQQG